MHIIGKLGLGIMSKKKWHPIIKGHPAKNISLFFKYFVSDCAWFRYFVIKSNFLSFFINFFNGFLFKKKYVFIHTFKNNCKIRT